MTKAEYAYAELRRRILHGEVNAGTRLRLRHLAGELRLSEMPSARRCGCCSETGWSASRATAAPP